MAQEPKPGVTAERRIIGDTRKLVLYLNSLDSDVYQVEVEGKGIGKIGVTLDIGHYTGDAYSSRNQAIINCSECPELQGSKQREERQVQLNDKGYGTEQLGPNRYLVVDLGRRAVPRPVYGTHGWERPQAGKEVWDR
ncbi:MAG TPA: hypothetical protein VLF68_00420 [Candidatus Saccharimonadales bacterium]|nr:hypothetical protein [Candidatus Saccharimonadales bacterium]